MGLYKILGILLFTLAGQQIYAATLYVDGSVAVSGNGSSWGTAKKRIPEALNAAVGGDQVWVHSGLYETTSTISMPNNVGLYGGFSGTELTLLERIPETNPTIIRRKSASTFSVITLSGSTGVTLDNLVITGGSSASGGGIACISSGASNTIQSCAVSGNSATNGGGIYLSASSPAIIDCNISGNVATNGGGGVYAVSSSAAVLTNSVLGGNKAATGGGGHCEASSPTFLNCTLSANSSNSNGGGGIYAHGGAAPQVKNCAITYNGSYGIAEGDVASAPVCTNNDFYKNVTRSYLRDGNTIIKSASKLNQIPGDAGNFTNGTPVYVMEGANRIGGSFTAAGAWSSADQKTTLTAGTALFTPNVLVGSTIALGTGRSPHRQALILSNTTTRIVVEDLDGSLASLAPNNSQYAIADYHIESGSGLLNKGTATGAPAFDIDGDARPQGGGYDVGVDELVIIPVNQAPINLVPGAQTIAEDTDRIFSSGNGNAITVTDLDAGSQPIRVTLSATNGVLTLGTTSSLTFVIGDGFQDSTMTFVATLGSINTSLSGLRFHPDLNFNGAAALTITSNDQGFTGTGGAKSDTDTITINVTAVNDAPTIQVPGAQLIPENISLIFRTSGGNAITVADVDAGTNLLSTTLTASHGTLTLSGTAGLTFTQGNGTSNTVVSFRGTLANINAALQGAFYSPASSYSGSALVTVAVNDQGFTGTGGAKSDFKTIPITVTPISNTPQLFNVAITPLVTEGGSANLTGNIADLDTGETYTLTVNWGDGSALQMFNLSAGATSFSVNHTFVDDNPSGTPFDTYTVGLSLLDAGGLSGSGSVPTTILNANPLISFLSLTSAVNEGSTATMVLSFTDVGVQDTHTVDVDWGDGEADTYNLSAGDLVLTATHQYVDDGVSLTSFDDAGVAIIVSDDDLGSATIASSVRVNNVPPSITNLFLPLVAGVDALTTLSGTIVDPGIEDSFDLDIDWGDGTSDQLPLDPGSTDFEIDNQYTAPGSYVVTLTLTDDDGGVYVTNRTIQVGNNIIALANLAVTNPVAEGTSATLTGQVGDSNPNATFTLTVDWKDGIPQVVSLPAGASLFSIQHQYLDDNPSGTPSDPKTISVQVGDSDARSISGNIATVIQNVPPQLSNVAFAGSVQQGGTATLNGTITDPGVLDTFSLSVNWGDGTATETVGLSAGATSFSRTHVYANAGNFVASVTLTDDDSGVASAQDQISVGAAISLTNLAITSPVNEGSSGNLTGNISSTVPAASFTLEVNWGDGGSTQTVLLPSGSTSFNVPHQFVDDNPSGTPSDLSQVNVRLVDSANNVALAQTSTIIQNVAPQLNNVAFDGNIGQGQTASLHGSFTDLGVQDSFSLSVNWGDGTSTETVPLGAGANGFTINHAYNAAGDFQASVVLSDDDTGSASAQASITVNGVIALNNLTITSPVNEGSSATLSANIASPNPSANMILQIDWGDGSTTQTVQITAGGTSFNVQHVYADDNPSGTPADTKDVSVYIVDTDSNSNSAQMAVTINNVAPQLSNVAFASAIQENGTAILDGNIIDPGTQDTFALDVNWGDGSSTQTFNLAAGATTFSPTHRYLQSGNYVATIVLTDDDTGTTTAQVFLAVNNVAPALTGFTVSSPVNFGASTQLSANIVDPGTQDSFTVSIDWGDGSGTQNINRPAGSTSVSTFHSYASPGSFPVQVSIQDSDGGTTGNYNATAVVTPLADVRITKTAAANTQPNGTLIYTLTVRNNGPNTAHSVVADDTLPASVTFNTVSTSAGSASFASGAVHAALGTMLSGASATVSIFTTVSGTASGTISNTATAGATETDSNMSNNTSTVNTTVVQPPVNADLQLSVNAPTDGAQGLPLTYTMNIHNAGPVTATNVVLTDLLPDTIEFISATPEANTTVTGELFQGGVVTATFASIPSGSDAAVSITVRPFVAGALSNSAIVAGDQFDPDLSTNTDGADTTVAVRQAADFQAQYLKIPVARCSTKKGITKCSIKGTLTISNPGAVTTQTITVRTLLSNDGVPDAGDLQLKLSSVKPIKAGKIKKLKISVKPPVGTSVSGKFLLVVLDSLDQVPNEVRERNNLIQFGPMP